MARPAYSDACVSTKSAASTKLQAKAPRVVLIKRMSRHQRLQQMFGSIPFSKLHLRKAREFDDLEVDEDEDDDDLDNDEAALSPEMEQAVAALCRASPGLTEEQALYFLLHSARGRELFGHLTKKETPPMMDRNDAIQAVVKQHGGLIALAKMCNAEGRSIGDLNESEFTDLIKAEAKAIGLSFEKYYTAPENIEVRKAHQLTRGF